jgi:beta-N-acetylhexosaminidase
MTDQEGGGVKRFPMAPPQRSPVQLGEDGSPGDARLEGQATGNFLAGLGIDVDLAPVLDVARTKSSAVVLRTFGSDEQRVSRLGLAFADGLADEGVIAVPKHFPGLGPATVSTDVAPVTIDARARALRRDLAPFSEAVSRGAEMIMVGLAVYPRYGAEAPAALSPEIVTELLRDRLGFEGVAITDDLEAPALEGVGIGEAQAAVDAAAAGADLLLFALGGGQEALPAVTRAMRRGELDLPAQLSSCARIVALKERPGSSNDGPEGAGP